MRRFYAPPESFTADRVILGVEETRHLRDVLRLRPTDVISVFDGDGREFRCLVEDIRRSSTSAIIEASIPPISPESPMLLTLAAAILKGDKFDLVVQKAVELGVTRLIPLLTLRCEVKMVPANRLERWRRIALEATKQCGRATLMEVTNAFVLEEVIARKYSSDLVIFSERNGVSISQLTIGADLTAGVGPEGGWADAELEVASANGASIVTLGGRVLRAETAAIAVSAILQNRYGDLN